MCNLVGFSLNTVSAWILSWLLVCYFMAKETYYMAKETFYMAKETYYMAKETYSVLITRVLSPILFSLSS